MIDASSLFSTSAARVLTYLGHIDRRCNSQGERWASPTSAWHDRIPLSGFRQIIPKRATLSTPACTGHIHWPSKAWERGDAEGCREVEPAVE